jgi:hypothetical protein
MKDAARYGDLLKTVRTASSGDVAVRRVEHEPYVTQATGSANALVFRFGTPLLFKPQ